MSLEGREEPDEQTDIDRRFAEIIEHLDPSFTVADTPAPLERPRAAGKSAADEQPEPEQPPTAPAPPPSPLAGMPAQWRMPPSGAESFLDDDEADTFVPAPPQPLPSGDDLGFWAMAGCLVGGPVWLLYLFFFDRYAQSLWWVLACAVFVAGVVQLIMRSPKNRDDLDDDDGAVL